MNERDFTLIDDYFSGLLAPDEARQVEARASAETDFGAEFSLRRDMENYPRRAAARGAFQAQVAEIGQDFFSENAAQKTDNQPLVATRVNIRRWMAAAASLALLAVALWFFNTPQKSLYEQYAQHGPMALTVRGTADALADEAQAAFNAGDYARALTALTELTRQQPDNTIAQIYRAICLTELGQSVEARTVLAPIAAGQSALRGEAIWLSAMSYLKEGNRAECRRVLQGIGSEEARFAQAQQLLGLLD